MKPHIYRSHMNSWQCRAGVYRLVSGDRVGWVDERQELTGYGHTPHEAYVAWACRNAAILPLNTEQHKQHRQ